MARDTNACFSSKFGIQSCNLLLPHFFVFWYQNQRHNTRLATVFSMTAKSNSVEGFIITGCYCENLLEQLRIAVHDKRRDNSLTVSSLGKSFSRRQFEIFSYFSQEMRFDMSCKFMKYHILFPGKNKKNIIKSHLLHLPREW